MKRIITSELDTLDEYQLQRLMRDKLLELEDLARNARFDVAESISYLADEDVVATLGGLYADVKRIEQVYWDKFGYNGRYGEQ